MFCQKNNILKILKKINHKLKKRITFKRKIKVSLLKLTKIKKVNRNLKDQIIIYKNLKKNKKKLNKKIQKIKIFQLKTKKERFFRKI